MIEIAKRFRIEGSPVACVPHGSGHINGTYHVTTDAGKGYALQRINTSVFHDVDLLMNGIFRVTNHLREQGLDKNHVLTIVPTKEGTLYHKTESGECWRVYAFVEGGICLDRVDSPDTFYQSGVAFGRFQQQLKSFDANGLGEVIPRFHDTPNRYRALHAAIESDAFGRVKEVQEEIAFALAREEDCGFFVDAIRDGRIPLRVTHNDTKINNVILDERELTPLCVIDLDTVMPGAAAYDFGDAIRFGASTASEDEQDLERVHFSLPLFEAFTRGYLQECGTALTQEEIDTLPRGAEIITLECGVRFLTDYLSGDTYFATHRAGQNLDRCHTQFKLVAEMEEKREEMAEIVASSLCLRT